MIKMIIFSPDKIPPPSTPAPPPDPGKRKKRSATPDVGVQIGPLPTRQSTRGAGDSMGLTVMLFADKSKYYLTSAFYEGFKVMIHHPEEFPEVREKGFVLAPGSEMFVAVDARGKLVHLGQ